ncbi:uncharacterized protein MYCFIDRAFT_174870 [Pseudocercospora fijiensis CIRAD86]|uniref:Uncharacterized protein n=1 Tax=Pseudocercospora fijiensis (strain CIRAD86) TaxID=383855 RepID=M3B237_PSEFD|nr:uncharacterized protein MYCFIDRAFT_174870 [Pseudocercospora fijiensis CIRAD86]EME83433.1 hypothetical protein MYCFIDRAFT_174870 [Pseudocercospora fijiensis CIRAD86]
MAQTPATAGWSALTKPRISAVPQKPHIPPALSSLTHAIGRLQPDAAVEEVHAHPSCVLLFIRYHAKRVSHFFPGMPRRNTSAWPQFRITSTKEEESFATSPPVPESIIVYCAWGRVGYANHASPSEPRTLLLLSSTVPPPVTTASKSSHVYLKSAATVHTSSLGFL